MKNVFLLLALVACGARLVAAPTPPHRSSYDPGQIQQWKRRLHVANLELQQAHWKQGYDIADVVVREMRERISGGDAAGDLLAVALLFRAVGESGLGRADDATWDFCTAQSFYPAYEKLDLSAYGPAGASLESARFRSGSPTGPEHPSDKPPETDVTPPKKLSGEAPEYPGAKAISCQVQPPINVKVVINKQGLPVLPFVFQGTDPVLALAALDALKTWRFEPARLNGEPVNVFFVLSVNFKLRQCY